MAACATTNGPAQVSNNNASQSALSGNFTADLNAFRATKGLGSLQQDPKLMRAAQLHANDMAVRGYFSHQSPNGPNGDNMGERLASAGCGGVAAAENIAQGQTTEAEVFSGWQNSPGHRRNMLGPRYTEYGLGRSGNTWVQVFSSGC